MGEAKRRKDRGLRPVPVKVREVTLEIPVDLDNRLYLLCPAEHSMREWLVGVLGAYADWAEKEKKRQESPLVLPATRMPTTVPPKGYVGRRA